MFLNRAQRVLIVIGLGVAVVVFGIWVTHLGSHHVGVRGLVPYAPRVRGFLPARLLRAGGLRPWARMLVWLGLIGAWSGSSLWLMRTEKAPLTSA